MIVLDYLPILRSTEFIYAVQIGGSIGFIASNRVLTLEDVSHLNATSIQDVSDKGWRSPN